MASNLPSQPYVEPRLPGAVSITDDVALGVNNALSQTKLFAEIAAQKTEFQYKRMEADIAQQERNYKHVNEFFDRIQDHKNAKVANEIILDEAARKDAKHKLEQAQARHDLNQDKLNAHHETKKLEDAAAMSAMARTNAELESAATQQAHKERLLDLNEMREGLKAARWGLTASDSEEDYLTQQTQSLDHQESIRKDIGIPNDEPFPTQIKLSEGYNRYSEGFQRLKTQRLDEMLSQFEHYKESQDPELRREYEAIETEYRKSLSAPGSRGYESIRDIEARRARGAETRRQIRTSRALMNPEYMELALQQNLDFFSTLTDEQRENYQEAIASGRVQIAPILTLDDAIYKHAQQLQVQFNAKSGTPTTKFKASSGHYEILKALVSSGATLEAVDEHQAVLVPSGEFYKGDKEDPIMIPNPDLRGKGANDIAIVFAFMKALDPNSVVRESEFLVAMDSVPLGDKMWQVFVKGATGEFLTKEQRTAMSNTALDAVITNKKAADEQARGMLVLIGELAGGSPGSEENDRQLGILERAIMGGWVIGDYMDKPSRGRQGGPGEDGVPSSGGEPIRNFDADTGKEIKAPATGLGPKEQLLANYGAEKDLLDKKAKLLRVMNLKYVGQPDIRYKTPGWDGAQAFVDAFEGGDRDAQLAMLEANQAALEGIYAKIAKANK